MKMTKYIALACVLLLTTACGYERIAPAHKGKILTGSGYQPEVLEPGRKWVGMWQSMVLIETGTSTYMEPVKVKLSDKLELKVDVRFRGRLQGNERVINAMFNDIDTSNLKDDTIKFKDVYGIYGQMVIRNKTREVIGQYSVDEVQKNYTRLSAELAVAIREGLEDTPIEISEVSLGNIDYPATVNDAINEIERRRLAIIQEEAQSEIEMTKKRNEKRLAEADYDVRMTKAKTIRDENITIGEGVTPQLLELKRLEVAESLAANSGESSKVFLPIEALTSTGASVEMFRGSK